MRLRHTAFICIYLILSFTSIHSQEHLPRIAIIPFNYINVSKQDAEVITSLFETALVNTEVFRVIEQNQIDEILKAQEYSLSDCSDTECAIQFGQLLSAEQIILGTLSAVGGKHILNAKIIDVAKGVNIKADRVDAGSLSEMTEVVELLAYKLAGLTYTEGAKEEIAKAFGEVFIQTIPEGAEIYINGIKKATSPFLITKVPVGKVTVECSKDNLFGMAVVEITPGTTAQVTIKLEETFGNLFVTSSENDVEVYLNGRSLGKLGSGFFPDIPAGSYRIEVKGKGLYWEDEIAINAGKSITVEAYPRAFGILLYEIPEMAEAEIKGNQFSKIVRGKGEIVLLWKGKYNISVTGEIFEPFKEEINIERSSMVFLKPELQYTKEHLAYLEKQHREKEFNLFSSRLTEAEKHLSHDYRIEESNIAKIIQLSMEIKDSKWKFPEIIAKSELLLQKAKEKKGEQDRQDEIKRLVLEKSDLVKRINSLQKTKKTKMTLGFSSLGTSLLSFGFSALSYFMSDSAYNDYLEATITSEAAKYRETVEMWDILMFTGIGVGGSSFILSGILLFTGPRMNEEITRLNQIEEEINVLRNTE